MDGRGSRRDWGVVGEGFAVKKGEMRCMEESKWKRGEWKIYVCILYVWDDDNQGRRLK